MTTSSARKSAINMKEDSLAIFLERRKHSVIDRRGTTKHLITNPKEQIRYSSPLYESDLYRHLKELRIAETRPYLDPLLRQLPFLDGDIIVSGTEYDSEDAQMYLAEPEFYIVMGFDLYTTHNEYSYFLYNLTTDEYMTYMLSHVVNNCVHVEPLAVRKKRYELSKKFAVPLLTFTIS
jgi:hypothetical protein